MRHAKFSVSRPQNASDADIAVVDVSNPAFLTRVTTTLQPLPVGMRFDTLVTCPLATVLTAAV
jgi:hypothetical protein